VRDPGSRRSRTFVFLDWSAYGAAELVLPVETAIRRIEIARIEKGISEELESAAVNLICSGFRGQTGLPHKQ
jgi:hypothetical protein